MKIYEKDDDFKKISKIFAKSKLKKQREKIQTNFFRNYKIQREKRP